jgi:DNA repair protein RadA/Sms
MLEEVVPRGSSSRPQAAVVDHRPRRIEDIEGEDDVRLALPIEEFSRVLGGGIVPGSVILIGGDPGVGKSTLLLQTALAVAEKERVLYISGEESERQLKTHVLRLYQGGTPPRDLLLLTETNLESILSHVGNLGPRLMVVDSIQTMQTADLDSSAGSVSQVRECAARLQNLAKREDIAVMLVGHVTKEGSIAGPKVMEHIVDTVLYLEGDSFQAFRLLRSVKNRFGATSEVGVFEMRRSGLMEVPNPSEAFLAERVVGAPGSAIAVTMEGTRPLLVEIQGLTSTTSFGNPRRRVNGVDFNRLLLTVAVLSRRVGLRLSDQDVFVNVVGGLRVDEPAVDLAVAAAIASSARDRALPVDLALMGEVGLSGELRAVPQLTARLREAAKLGFKRALVPKRVSREEQFEQGLEVVRVRTLSEALKTMLGD